VSSIIAGVIFVLAFRQQGWLGFWLTEHDLKLKYVGSIYGPILFAWGAAGAVGPMLMEYIRKSSNSFTPALSIAAVLLALDFILTLFYRKPKLDGLAWENIF
jgi:ABC-type sulfate transport system permease component